MGRRAAQLWKNQEQLTELGVVNNALPIESQFRVKIALKMMRKSHTKTVRTEAEKRNGKKKEVVVEHDVEHIGAPSANVQDDTVHIRSLDEIMKEAKYNFNLKKDKRKMDKDSTKFGQKRPIFVALVEEICAEQEEMQRVRDERDENEIENLHDGDGHVRLSRVSLNVKKRKSMQRQRPHSATAVMSGAHRRSTSPGGAHMLASQEAPAMLQGERARMLSAATLGIADTTGANRRHELVPIRSAEVLARSALDAELNGQAHGRISRTQKELMQHLQNAQHLQDSTGHTKGGAADGEGKSKAAAAGTGGAAHTHAAAVLHKNNKPVALAALSDFTTTQSGKFKPSKDGNAPLEVKFALPPTGRGLDVVHEDSASHDSGRNNAELDPMKAVENLMFLLARGKAEEAAPQTELTPSQMMLQKQKGSHFLGGQSDGDMGNQRSFAMLREQASSKRSSFFSASAVRDDEKISRAQSQRDEIHRLRDEELKQRILKREQQNQTKAELALFEQKQRAWAMSIVSLARFSILIKVLTKHRFVTSAARDANDTKKAVSLIERWWRRGRVRIIFRRFPWVVQLFRRTILRFNIRLRLRRKRNAATLLTVFLQDSTGMSETMRAIYAFRQTVIRLQRWIRKWLDVQYCRMRILWLKCERMYREKMRRERANEPKEEAHTHHVISATSYFTETVEEIGHKRKQLGRLLEDQENARHARQQEAKALEEALRRKREADELRRKKKQGRNKILTVEAVNTTRMVTTHAARKLPARQYVTPWHIRIRSSGTNILTYDLLRDILKYERRRHILNLVKHNKIGDECLINAHELRRYLKNPNSYDGVNEISKKLAEVRVVARSPADIYRTPFLLLTMGGIDAMDLLLKTNRYVKF